MSKRKKIVFQGEPGANSDIACREAYPDYQPLPCPTFEDALGAVLTGHFYCTGRSCVHEVQVIVRDFRTDEAIRERLTRDDHPIAIGDR